MGKFVLVLSRPCKIFLYLFLPVGQWCSFGIYWPQVTLLFEAMPSFSIFMHYTSINLCIMNDSITQILEIMTKHNEGNEVTRDTVTSGWKTFSKLILWFSLLIYQLCGHFQGLNSKTYTISIYRFGHPHLTDDMTKAL